MGEENAFKQCIPFKTCAQNEHILGVGRKIGTEGSPLKEKKRKAKAV